MNKSTRALFVLSCFIAASVSFSVLANESLTPDTDYSSVELIKKVRQEQPLSNLLADQNEGTGENSKSSSLNFTEQDKHFLFKAMPAHLIANNQ